MEPQSLFSKSNLDKQRPFRGEVSAENVRKGTMSYRIDVSTGTVRETLVHAFPPHVNAIAPFSPMIFSTVRDAACTQELVHTSQRAQNPLKQKTTTEKKDKVQVDRWCMVSSFPDRSVARGADKHREREAKWLLMIANWDRFLRANPAKVKSRCRKGVPDSLRGMVWSRLTGAQREMESLSNRGLYQSYLGQTPKAEALRQIRADIRRVFPKHILFKQTAEQSGGHGNEDKEELYTPGQLMLSNVLKAFAVRNPLIGYCQAMGALAATFLMYMPEELAFWMMDCFLMTRDESRFHRFGMVYADGLPLLQQLFYVFDRLIRRMLPKIHTHFQENNVLMSLYATKWFQLLFSEFPREMVMAIWDIFFSEGVRVLYQVGIAVLARKEKQLLKLEGNDLLELVRDLAQAPEFRDTQSVIEFSLKQDISHKEIKRLESEYEPPGR